uniref:Uncharacterized protein n=1 Tax=Nelumbo nucifera TaxID=4432 RepID=A0A822XNB2_NELNU|nr:TPA_asm: hypothetical protein HUJ06_020471 [Nelumbo nucifera]
MDRTLLRPMLHLYFWAIPGSNQRGVNILVHSLSLQSSLKNHFEHLSTPREGKKEKNSRY